MWKAERRESKAKEIWVHFILSLKYRFLFYFFILFVSILFYKMRIIEVDIMNNWGEDLIWRNYLGLPHAFNNSESIKDSKGKREGH